MRREINRITWIDRRGVLKKPLRLAIAADLHNRPFDDLVPCLREAEAILVPGDLTDRHHYGPQTEAERFLAEAPDIAPVWCSIGNHERRMEEGAAWRARMEKSRVHVLDNDTALLREDVLLGGLSSRGEGDAANTAAVDALAAETDRFRLLLCHHPEYYFPEVAGKGIDLTIAGHAHGGQFRLFGQGLFAPGQGFFPRLTGGFYDGERLLVSRGLSNHSPIPRINNPGELILLTLLPASGELPSV